MTERGADGHYMQAKKEAAAAERDKESAKKESRSDRRDSSRSKRSRSPVRERKGRCTLPLATSLCPVCGGVVQRAVICADPPAEHLDLCLHWVLLPASYESCIEGSLCDEHAWTDRETSSGSVLTPGDAPAGVRLEGAPHRRLPPNGGATDQGVGPDLASPDRALQLCESQQRAMVLHWAGRYGSEAL